MENPSPEIKTKITVQNLTVAFFNRKVLQGIDANIIANQATVILGRSGSGKTTFLRTLNRLNECFPGFETRGDVEADLAGQRINLYAPTLSLSELRRRVGMVFQEPNVLPISIARNLMLPLKLGLGISGKPALLRMERVLKQVHLLDEVSGRLDDPAVTLSGGQQQRLCLARCLILDPEILLLDEPTASLDFQAAEHIEDLIQGLKGRVTLVIVSHGLDQAVRLADRIMVLKDGRLGPPIDPAEFYAVSDPELALKRLL